MIFTAPILLLLLVFIARASSMNIEHHLNPHLQRSQHLYYEGQKTLRLSKSVESFADKARFQARQGDFVIGWASPEKTASPGDRNHMFMYTSTEDFHMFKQPFGMSDQLIYVKGAVERRRSSKCSTCYDDIPKGPAEVAFAVEDVKRIAQWENGQYKLEYPHKKD